MTYLVSESICPHISLLSIIFVTIYLSIHLSIYLSIHLSIYLLINLSIMNRSIGSHPYSPYPSLASVPEAAVGSGLLSTATSSESPLTPAALLLQCVHISACRLQPRFLAYSSTPMLFPPLNMQWPLLGACALTAPWAPRAHCNLFGVASVGCTVCSLLATIWVLLSVALKFFCPFAMVVSFLERKCKHITSLLGAGV